MKSDLKLILLIVFSGINFHILAQTPLMVANVEMSTCDSRVDFRKIQPRIINQGFDSTNIYSLTIGTIANCAGIYNESAKINGDTLFIDYSQGHLRLDTIRAEKTITEIHLDENNDTLDIIYADSFVIEESIEEAMCTCCFEFRFDIVGLINEPCFIKINRKLYHYYPQKYRIEPFMFKVIEGDTINRIDENGLKQGFWDAPYSDRFERLVSRRFKFYAIYKDDKPVVAQIRSFYKDGKVKEIVKFKGYRHIETVSFKKSGRKIRLK